MLTIHWPHQLWLWIVSSFWSAWTIPVPFVFHWKVMPRKNIYIYPIYSFWKQNKHETTISTFAPIHSWDSRSCDSWTLQARPFLTSPRDFPTFCKSFHTPTEAIRVRGQAFCPRRCPFGHGGTLVPAHLVLKPMLTWGSHNVGNLHHWMYMMYVIFGKETQWNIK